MENKPFRDVPGADCDSAEAMNAAMKSPEGGRVLLLEDHKDAQQWLASAIRCAFGSEVEIDITDRVAEAIDLSARNHYTLIVSDLNLPDGSGIELILACKQRQQCCPCIVSTIYSDDQHLFPALQAGADGYLLKDDEAEDIAEMLEHIYQGKPPISSQIASRILKYFQSGSGREDRHTALTPREKETLIYISKGMTSRDCAELMDISPNTASEYIKNVYRKLDIHSRAEAVSEAIRIGIT